jgi:hypothetical protein
MIVRFGSLPSQKQMIKCCTLLFIVAVIVLVISAVAVV